MDNQRTTNLPWLIGEIDDQITVGGVNPGGRVFRYTAEEQLKVGDIVYFKAAGKVGKSNTAANYQAACGVVVGGAQTYGNIPQDWTVATQPVAAEADEYVLIACAGIVYCVSDAAIALHAKIGQGATTAGRIDDVAASAGQRVGIALASAGGAAEKIPVFIALM